MHINSVYRLALPLAACLLFAGPSYSAPCSEAYYRDVVARSAALVRNSKVCERELKRRRPDLAKMCGACRSSFIAFSRLDSRVRRNRSCFPNDRRTRKAFADLAYYRQAINFVRRGCGY